jgi:hypothetical protein
VATRTIDAGNALTLMQAHVARWLLYVAVESQMLSMHAVVYNVKTKRHKWLVEAVGRRDCVSSGARTDGDRHGTATWVSISCDARVMLLSRPKPHHL